ncbi:DUF418 domain-containing protein [Parahaliea maris]|uniref:DUF418 domain-containing protein n=1 Tax=Parahaliea maris TaxID=2716870 RepID=A0A5C9A5E0_9GAMM|nr:DUF418 domain-containing protein [Parahaliea maris]TXS95299.1 DUF418 domain-containing protein [Parahaliea maris]
MSVPPTALPTSLNERIDALDSARGLALLGILIMNSTGMALVGGAYLNITAGGGDSTADLLSWLMMGTFFEGSMRALFSILFGAGMLLFIDRLEAKNTTLNPLDIHARRMLLLIGFGLINMLVIVYPYDILLFYGICGLLLFAFRNLSPRGLAVLFAALFAVQLLNTHTWVSSTEEQYAKYQSAKAELASGTTLDDEQQSDIKSWEKRHVRWQPDEAKRTEERELYTEGTALELWQKLAKDYLGFFASRSFWRFLTDCLMAVALGMLMYRAGLMVAPSRGTSWSLLLAGYGVGLGVGAYRTWSLWSGGFNYFSVVEFTYLYDIRRLAIGIGHLALVQLLFSYNILGALRRVLGAIGRMAFTNYLMQSVFQVLVWYGFGLGLHQQVDRAEIWLVILPIWAFQAIFSVWWLRRYSMGPLEWLWRALTYGTRPSLRLGQKTGGALESA